MIDWLIVQAIVKYRHIFWETEQRDAIDRALEPGAGIDYEPPAPDNVIPIRGRKWLS